MLYAYYAKSIVNMTKRYDLLSKNIWGVCQMGKDYSSKNYLFEYCIMDCDLYCRHKRGDVDVPSTVTLHNHDGYEILLFLAGDVSLFVESEEKKMERGDLVLIRPYEFHGVTMMNTESYERITLDFREDYLISACDEKTDLSLCFNRESGSRINYVHLDEDAIPQYVELARKMEDYLRNNHYGAGVMLKSLFSIFMVQVNQHAHTLSTPSYSSIMPPVVSKIFDYISSNLTNDITVEDIANALHHNSDYLNRAFKNVTGRSLKQYISAKKISLAQQYLTQGYAPYDVCFMVGYKNYSSFSRRFSELLGISPKQYQLKYQSGYLGSFRN